MKTTILGGILFLAPLAVIAILLGKVYQIGLLVAAPLDQLIPVTQIGGLALVNILAVIMILVVCFLAGLVARGQFMQARVRRIDDLLIDVVPTYAVFKGMLGSISGSKDVASLMKPVMVKFDDYDQIAFEMERDEAHAVLFIPGSPSAWSGTTVVVTLDRVRPLNLPTHQAVKLMRVMGRGTLATQRTLTENQAH